MTKEHFQQIKHNMLVTQLAYESAVTVRDTADLDVRRAQINWNNALNAYDDAHEELATQEREEKDRERE